MPQALETMSRRVHWGYKQTDLSSKGNSHWSTFEASWEHIDGRMAELAAALTEDGWEIKSVVPLVGSRTFLEALTNHQGMSSTWGAGYGFAASYTEGVVVIAQRWVEVSQEEADRRQSIRVAKDRAKAEAAAAAQRQAEHDRTLAMPVDRRGIFDATWSFAGEAFGTKQEAEAARLKLARSKLETV